MSTPETGHLGLRVNPTPQALCSDAGHPESGQSSLPALSSQDGAGSPAVAITKE